jgi:hypothetical protein
MALVGSPFFPRNVDISINSPKSVPLTPTIPKTVQFFTNPSCPAIGKYVIAFVGGFVFAPWSWGLVYFLIFLLLYEIFIYYLCRKYSQCWDKEVRLGIIVFSVLGFILGRILVKSKNIL